MIRSLRRSLYNVVLSVTDSDYFLFVVVPLSIGVMAGGVGGLLHYVFH